MTKPKFKDGSRVLYAGTVFKIINSYYKDYPHCKGWFYNLNHIDKQRIAESDLSPLMTIKDLDRY